MFDNRRRRRRRPTPSGSPQTRPPAGLSAYDPIHFGVDENGDPVEVVLAYRNLLIGGEPGSGKSSLLNTVLAHGALSPNTRLWLFDGKLVELRPWSKVADVFVGNSMADALRRLYQLQAEMELRYRLLDAAARRKILPVDDLDVIMCVIDELAYFTATVGTKEEQELFRSLVRDLVARGRAAGIIVVAATQRPSADIVPTSLRDLFGFRVAFRCTTDSSSDIILSVGWAGEGFSAKSIYPEDLGVGFILAEGGTPRRFKAAYLTDPQIRAIATVARQIRDQRPPAA